MYCRNCGQETNGARFCTNCGAEQTPLPPYQQPNLNTYQQPTYNIRNNAPQRPVADMSIGEWMITILFSIIPILGLIFMLFWALGKPGYRPSRKNWAAANLILSVIISAIGIIVFILVLAPAFKSS